MIGFRFSFFLFPLCKNDFEYPSSFRLCLARNWDARSSVWDLFSSGAWWRLGAGDSIRPSMRHGMELPLYLPVMSGFVLGGEMDERDVRVPLSA